MRLEQGQQVGDRYTLVARLGTGGMADVWLAQDRMLDRRVALKFLDERFAQDAQFVERFRREAQAAAGLQHPNVVGVYDRGETDGRHWIAMEYVEGAMLKDLIARGLSVGEAVEITRQILSGARFAHARGIVHRDLKPQNVLVDREGRARVTDFGIARAGASEITATGSVLGTAQYLSPEQAQGLDVTATSDIYSIGVMLYEALTGRVPFDAETPVAVALKQVSEQPQSPVGDQPAGAPRRSTPSSSAPSPRTRRTAFSPRTSSCGRSMPPRPIPPAARSATPPPTRRRRWPGHSPAPRRAPRSAVSRRRRPGPRPRTRRPPEPRTRVAG